MKAILSLYDNTTSEEIVKDFYYLILNQIVSCVKAKYPNVVVEQFLRGCSLSQLLIQYDLLISTGSHQRHALVIQRYSKPGILAYKPTDALPMVITDELRRITSTKAEKEWPLQADSLKNKYVLLLLSGLSRQACGNRIQGWIIKHYGFTSVESSKRKGDCTRNGLFYEIKSSMCINTNQFNFVQIRVAHHIQYYILSGYHLNDTNDIKGGTCYVFKIPHDVMLEIVLAYSQYAHGTIEVLGKITRESIHDPNNTKEYAVRPVIGSQKWKDLYLPYLITNYDEHI